MLQKPVSVSIDDIRLDRFEVGQEYEVGSLTASVLLAEGWAEPVSLDAPAEVVSFDEPVKVERRVRPDPTMPTNLIREAWPPSLDQAVAADLRRRRGRSG